MALTTSELIDAVRQQIDETSEADITDQHILDALNRSLTNGYNTVAKVHPDPLVTFTDFTVTSASQIDLPETIFEDRVLHVDHLYSNTQRRLRPSTYSDLHLYEYNVTTNYPQVWAVLQRELLIRPMTSGGAVIRVWHVKAPEKLVKPQGRITRLGSDYFVVDSYGNGLSTDADELNSYFNVISFNKGDVKWSGQVKTIVGDKITHKTTVSRSTVLNQTIGTDHTTPSPAIREDDYICEVGGTCVPYLPVVLENYILQHAIVDLLDRLGHDSTFARQTLGQYNKALVKQWAGRASTTRVKLTSSQWTSSSRNRRSSR